MPRPSAITSLKDAPASGKKNWLIYAESGVGKTVLAGTAPRALFLTVEAAGTESAKKMGSTADEWVVDTWRELQEAYKWLKEEGHREYDWAILDSISEAEESAWADLLNGGHTARIQDYGTIGSKMKSLVDGFNRLPINMLYTAQTMRLEIEDEETDEDSTLLIPLLGTRNGAVSQKVCGKVTLVGLLTRRVKTNEETGETREVRRLMLQGSKRFVAKDRHMIAPVRGYVTNPNIARMVEKADATRDDIQTPDGDEPSGTIDAAAEAEQPRRRRSGNTDSEGQDA